MQRGPQFGHFLGTNLVFKYRPRALPERLRFGQHPPPRFGQDDFMAPAVFSRPQRQISQGKEQADIMAQRRAVFTAAGSAGPIPNGPSLTAPPVFPSIRHLWAMHRRPQIARAGSLF